MFKEYIKEVKPINKEEAIKLFKINRKSTLNNSGWFKTVEKEKELNSLLSSEYDVLIKNNPTILNRDSEKIIVNNNCSIPESELQRLWDTMNGIYIWVDRSYIVSNVNKNIVNNTWYIEFENEITSIPIATR